MNDTILAYLLNVLTTAAGKLGWVGSWKWREYSRYFECDNGIKASPCVAFSLERVEIRFFHDDRGYCETFMGVIEFSNFNHDVSNVATIMSTRCVQRLLGVTFPSRDDD
jgi:hypothetical protein